MGSILAILHLSKSVHRICGYRKMRLSGHLAFSTLSRLCINCHGLPVFEEACQVGVYKEVRIVPFPGQVGHGVPFPG